MYDTRVTRKTTENLYIPEQGQSVLERPKLSMPVKLPTSNDKRHDSLLGFDQISTEINGYTLKKKNAGQMSVSNAKSKGTLIFKDASRENARTPASTGRKNLNFNQESSL